ncbi:hypothetical protein F4821DRAFT_280140 [Hypoxylon rubiginosum]|uniref:Uncharacterized protein n=1 Tax=Hypoxylon rubiginosum TaxID=110542 RepID=A0ACC0DGA5_9PEZI|nr:hypothetical protein F4821DRAFT_280140 [Hypoxylon rubiginosum]
MCRIYLVGFPGARADCKTASLAGMIRYAVPEVSVLDHNVYRHVVNVASGCSRGNETKAEVQDWRQESLTLQLNDQGCVRDGAEERSSLECKRLNDIFNKNSVSFPRDSEFSAGIADNHFFSSAWVNSEAFRLLKRVQQEAPTQTTSHPSKVLLAGYGFGGIIIKKAIVMANTSPVFYDVAFSVASLIFFTMQHQPSDNSTWEEVILEMIRETSENYTGQLASILPGLVESIPRISHAFNQIATKYAIMNITSNDVNSVPDTQSTNSLWSTVVWPRAEKNDFSSYTTDDLAKLEILRKEFAPPSIVCYQVQAVAPIYHIYSQALQVLSPSRRIIYEGSTTHELDNLNLLAQVYHTHLCDVSLRKVRGGSIQVTTTKEHEKSAIVKLVSRNLRQESSAVVIESSPHDQASLYDVMISLIHQIISQRPTLFSHIQNLMVEMLQQSIWTKEAVEHALHSIFIHSEGVDFIIVIHNFDSPLWPDEIRIWWSNIPTFLGTSNCSTCTFLISCNQPKGNLTAGRLHHVDLETLSPSPREAFINAKINQLFENAFTSASRKGLFYESAKERLIARATKFEGSFNDINAFIIHIFHGLSLTAPNAILRDMSLIPPTPEELYKSHLQLLKWKDPMVFCWAKNFLAWVKLSVRPLRMEELAVATAIVPGQIHIVEIRDSIAIDIERDIRKYLRSLVLSVEHVLSETSSLDLADDSNLALKCLSYLTLVLKAPEEGNLWEKMEGIPEPTLEFLDYAIRYWPTHFLRAKSPNSILATTVVQWFQLYLLCNGFRPILPHGGRNLPIRLTANSKEVYDNATTADFKIDTSMELSPNAIAMNLNTRPSAIEMASLSGLSSIIPILLGEENMDTPNQIHVRRGFFQSRVAISNTDSRDYLESIISNDDSKTVASLLDIDKRKLSELFPLHMAVLAGSPKTTQVLLSKLERTTEVDKHGRTVFHMAAIGGRVDIFEILLEGSKGTQLPKWLVDEIHKEDNNAETPLTLATRMGNFDAACLLAPIGNGRGLSIPDGTGKTPAHHAVINCPQALPIFFAQNPGILLAQDQNGATPLHIAAGYGRINAVLTITGFEIDPEARKKMIEMEDNQEMAPLHCAVQNGFDSVVDILIQDEAINMKTLSEIAAELATKHGNLHILRKLKRWTGDIKTHLLSEAAKAGQILVTKYLLQTGAKPNGDEDSSDKPLGIAASKGHQEAGASVNSFGSSDKTPLFIACYQGNIGVVRALLANDADPSLCSRDDWSNGWSPLHAAADSVDISKLLVESHAAINYQKHDGWAPIHLAAGWGHQDVVQFLLGEGADPNILNEDGNAPLHIAIKRGRHDVLKTMIDHKGNNTIDFNIINKEGLAPIHMAIQLGVEAVKILLDKRVDFKVRTAHGLSCLDLAVSLYSNEVLKCLLLASNSGDYVPDWDRQNIVAAYWRAVELTNIESGVLHTLLELDHSLVVEVSEEGFNGLETYMRGRKADEGGRHNPLVFLDFEFNPFQHPPGEKSAFELGATVEHGVNREFLEKCVGILHRYPQVSSLGFRELRIITELDGQIPIEAIDSMGDSIKSEIDGDGWNIDHFIYQSSPRLGFSRRENGMIDKETSKPTSWRKEISEDNIQTELGVFDTLTLRADFAFQPRNMGLPYFEIIIQDANDPELKSRNVSIGLTSEFSDQNPAHAGQSIWSLGYHGINGTVYEDKHKEASTRHPFGPGDIVGCGIDYDSEEYLFTVNGEIVSRHSSKIIYRKMYPCVTYDSTLSKIKGIFGTNEFAWTDAKSLARNRGDTGKLRLQRRLSIDPDHIRRKGSPERLL